MQPANRLGLDYIKEAERIGPPPIGITDVHAHINGVRATDVYRVAADAYGISHLCSMTRFDQTEAVSNVLGDRVHFIAIPDFSDPDPEIRPWRRVPEANRRFPLHRRPHREILGRTSGHRLRHRSGRSSPADPRWPVRRAAMDRAAELDGVHGPRRRSGHLVRHQVPR